MTRLKRITNKIFGSTASPDGDATNGAYIGQFGSAKLGTYNATADVEEIQALSAWDNGWIDAVIPNQQYPTLPEMTGVGKVLSYQTGYLHQEGVSEWDAGTEYYINSIVKYASSTTTQNATGSIGDSTGLTGVNVDKDVFLGQINVDGSYTFTFDGSDWYYNDILTDLSLYGITPIGTAVADDEIIVTVTTTTVYNEQSKLYISLVDNNINIIPTSDNTKWDVYLHDTNFVQKSGDTMTGTLAFDKDLSGINIPVSPNPEPCVWGRFDHVVGNANPASNIYALGRIVTDNGATPKLLGREYWRFGSSGVMALVDTVYNYDANNDATSASTTLSVSPDGVTGFAFPKCDTKATTTSSASSSKVAVVTQNYVNGTSWYRVWSDGWIEQGGYASTADNTNSATITFLKPFANTKYNIQATIYCNGTLTSHYSLLAHTLTASSMKLYQYVWGTSSYGIHAYWYACGY